MRARLASSLVLAAAALTGCAGLGFSRGATTTQPSKLQQAQSTHEYPSPAPAPQRAAGGSVSAVEAIRSFAGAYINWSAQTVPADMHDLAARSVGQARSATQLAAAQTANDYELKRAGIANRGTVEAVARLAGRGGRYAVLTLEATTATNTNAYQGLRPAWHVTIATVAELAPERWVVSGWQPES